MKLLSVAAVLTLSIPHLPARDPWQPVPLLHPLAQATTRAEPPRDPLRDFAPLRLHDEALPAPAPRPYEPCRLWVCGAYSNATDSAAGGLGLAGATADRPDAAYLCGRVLREDPIDEDARYRIAARAGIGTEVLPSASGTGVLGLALRYDRNDALGLDYDVSFAPVFAFAQRVAPWCRIGGQVGPAWNVQAGAGGGDPTGALVLEELVNARVSVADDLLTFELAVGGRQDLSHRGGDPRLGDDALWASLEIACSVAADRRAAITLGVEWSALGSGYALPGDADSELLVVLGFRVWFGAG